MLINILYMISTVMWSITSGLVFFSLPTGSHVQDDAVRLNSAFYAGHVCSGKGRKYNYFSISLTVKYVCQVSQS